MLGDRREPVVRGFGERFVRRIQEICVGAFPATAHPAPQLVQLGQPEHVGAFHDEGVRVGDVQPRLDDGGTYQDVELLLPEGDHHLLEGVLAHLTVRGGDAGLGDEVAQPRRGRVDRLHPVVDEEDLPLPQQLTADRGGDLPVVARPDEGQDRVPLLRRGVDRRQLPDTGDRHFQCPRDRGGAHGEHVHRGPHFLQVFLVFDAEALLLVDDHQAEVLETGRGRQQPMRSYHHVDGAVGKSVEHRLLLGRGIEARHRPYVHGKRGIPLGEHLEMLLDEQCRRDENGDLFTVLHRLERRPYRDLGLAVADVAADDPVHRDGFAHVGLDLLDGRELVGGLPEREGVLQLPLPWGVRAEGVSRRGHPRAVQADQLAGDLLDGLAGASLALRPVGAADPVEARALATDVTGDLFELVGRDVQTVALRVLEDEVLAGGAGDRPGHHLDVPADPVGVVDDQVAGAQRERVDALAAPVRHPAHVTGGHATLAGEVGLGQDRDAQQVAGEAAAQLAAGNRGHATGEVGVLGEAGAQVGVPQQFDEPLGGARPLGHQQDPPGVGEPALDVRERPRGVAVVGGGRPQAGDHRVVVEIILAGGRVPRLIVIGTAVTTRAAPGAAGPGCAAPGTAAAELVAARMVVDGDAGTAERADRPPRQVDLPGPLAHLRDRPVGRRAEIDRSAATAGGRAPGRLQELVARAHQLGGPGPDPFRVAHQHVRAGGQLVEHQHHLVAEHRRERLHAVHRDAVRDPVEHVEQFGMRLCQLPGPSPDRWGEQQLTARRREQLAPSVPSVPAVLVVGRAGQRPLVGH